MEAVRSEVSVGTGKKGAKVSWLTITSIVLGLLALGIDAGNFIGFIPLMLGILTNYSIQMIDLYIFTVPPSIAFLSVLIAIVAVIRASRKTCLKDWFGWSLGALAVSVLAFMGSIVVIFGNLLSKAL